MQRTIACVVFVVITACGPSSTSLAGECPGHAGGEQPATATPASAPTRDALVGTWAEYWSVAGEAATAQYAFQADGSYTWQAVPSSQPTVAARSGRWELTGGTVVLTATSQDERPGCPTACESGGARRVTLDPPIVERLAIESCPPNEEARKLDPSYTCMSLGERSFWRR